MKKIFNIISTFIFIVLIVLAGILFVPKAFNVQPTAVLSGSMEPTYPVGSLIFVDHNISKEDIEVGKAITFKISDTTLVTHRVVEINDKGEYVTKGDANKSNDGDAVKFENVVGMPKFVIPYLGYIASYATTTSGMILLVTIILVLILLTFIPDWISSDKKAQSKGGNLNEEK